LPSADDLAASRAFLSGRLLPALVAAKPRAIVLDFAFVGAADASADRALAEALDAAARNGVPVVAGTPIGRPSHLPVCRGETTGCLSALGDISVPTGELRAWPLCVGDQPTLGLIIAGLTRSEDTAEGDWRAAPFCSPEPIPLQLPPDDPCARPWKRIWVSELLSGQPFVGTDPITLQPARSCGVAAADLADAVVIVGDPRGSAAGKDVQRLGDRDGGPVEPFAGPEVHAVIAWNIDGVLP